MRLLLVGRRIDPTTDEIYWDKIATIATAITMVRAIVASSMFAYTITTWSATTFVLSVLVFYLGDLLDGAAARRLQRETRFGALADVMADRLSGTLMVVAYISHHRVEEVSLVAFALVAFLLDTTLAAAFLRFDLLSPNYFYMVSSTVWAWNFSRPAMFVHGALAPFLVILAPAAVVVLWAVVSGLVRACAVRTLTKLCQMSRPGPAVDL